MRLRALVALMSGLLACGDDGGAHDESTTATSVTTASGPSSFPLGTTDAASEPTTADATSDTATDSPSTTTDAGTSTGLITTFFTTGDNDITGFDTGGPPCDQALKATVRDFRVDHPDFEDFTGDAAYPGLVLPDLGADDNPVYAAAGATPQTSGPAQFAQWYGDVANINIPFAVELQLVEADPGIYSYQSGAFFPIDDQGWGNEGNPHNFHFTTEIHTTFDYNGGEQFTFTGDDDLWLFINNKLAIDLGGAHPPLSVTADLDVQAATLGIKPGNSYAMDIFHAERHTDQSNFRIDTSIECFYVPE